MSVRGQERRVREVMRRSDEVARRSGRRMQGAARQVLARLFSFGKKV